MKSFDFFKCDEDFMNYLFEITGDNYSFNIAPQRVWGNKPESGVFYQLMPEINDAGFFLWYCKQKPKHQLFKIKSEAVLRFVIYWLEWKKEMQADTVK